MKVAVSVVAFSKNEQLVKELIRNFPDSKINSEGKRIQKNELAEYYKGAEAIIVGLEKIDDELLSLLPDLKIIAKYGVGLDNIDLEACNKRGIEVGWTAGVNKHAVAEMTLGFMLMLSRNLYLTSNQLKTGLWNRSGGNSLLVKTIGIIGLGHIGKEVVRLLTPIGSKLLCNDILDVSSFALENQIQVVGKEEIYKSSDIISVHTPLTELTRNMINKEAMILMKSSTFIINSARGGIINEEDLKWALKNQIIAGAALDVYNEEPPIDHELLEMPNLICTPHIGGNSYEAVVAMGMSAIEHLLKFQNSKGN